MASLGLNFSKAAPSPRVLSWAALGSGGGVLASDGGCSICAKGGNGSPAVAGVDVSVGPCAVSCSAASTISDDSGSKVHSINQSARLDDCLGEGEIAPFCLAARRLPVQREQKLRNWVSTLSIGIQRIDSLKSLAWSNACPALGLWVTACGWQIVDQLLIHE